MQMQTKTRALDKIYKRRDRYEIPDWQREQVWSDDKKRLLIDSILKGWKLPKFYFLKLPDSKELYEVVDGQQRLSAIFDFMDGTLTLSKEMAEVYGGSTYEELPADLSDTLDDFEIEYDEIEDANEDEVREFFLRLQEGIQLNASEKLNAINSKLRIFCRKLSEHSFFANKVAFSGYRYSYFDVATKVAAIEIEGLDAGLRYDDLKSTFESHTNFSDKSKVATRLRDVFDYLDRVFPQKEPMLRNRTFVQAIATLTASLLSSGKADGYEGKLYDFVVHFMGELSRQVELGQAATDADYVAFQRTVNANKKEGPRRRQEILLRKLLIFDPAVIELLEPTAVALSGVRQQIPLLGESIGSLIGAINVEHAARQGVDMFKATNLTAQALIKIGKPVEDAAGYESFIDDLYFLVHESTGERLADRPDSFKDVKDLRTDLRHDLDHGSGGKAKRKKVGNTFKKYAGEGTPDTLAPDRLPLAQVTILTAIEADLRALLVEVAKGPQTSSPA